MIEPSVYFIAEAGVNHNGDRNIARSLIDAAVESGADAVKFQSFKAEKLASPQAGKAEYQRFSTRSDESQLEMLRGVELNEDDHQVLFNYCREKRIHFLSTPFDCESTDMLDQLGVRSFKIGSGDLTNLPLLRWIASKKKPIILSTGMSDLGEVREALDTIFSEDNKDVTLLHCVTEYPAPVDQVNLRAMVTMKESFKKPVGYSDHTLGSEVALAAVALGATIIEKHFTLNRKMNGPDHRASVEPAELKDLISGIRKVSSALGDGVKKPASCEMGNVDLVRRSIFAGIDIPAGRTIQKNMLECKRPGTGIPPRCYEDIIGLKASRMFKAGEMLSWDGIKGNES